MLQFSDLNNAGAMETRDHSKNGASLKSQMSKKNLRFTLLVLFSIIGTSLFSQVSDIYKHNPQKRDSKEVAELKNSIEITGNNCGNPPSSLCSDVYVKNKTNNKIWMSVSGWWSTRNGGGTYSIVICLGPNENKKIPHRVMESEINVSEVNPISKTENLKFVVNGSVAKRTLIKQVYNSSEYVENPEISITDESIALVPLTHIKVYFDMLIIDDLGNKQVVSKSEIIDDRSQDGSWMLLLGKYINQYNYSKFWAKVTRIDIAETIDIAGKFAK